MKLFFGGLSAIVLLFLALGLSNPAQAADRDQSAGGIALPAGFRAASFSCWWYSVAKAAVRGKAGIYDTSMLVRRSPFAEWVVIYFDPAQTNEQKILKLIRSQGCPNAGLIRSNKLNATMNPYIASGDTVQLRIELKEKQLLSIKNLPKGWAISTPLDAPFSAGTHYLNIRTPKGARRTTYTLRVKPAKTKLISYRVEIASLVS